MNPASDTAPAAERDSAPAHHSTGDATAHTATAHDATDGVGRADMVVVANRLPFDLQVQPDGSTVAVQAPGGLVTALAPILAQRGGAWIGWPGAPDIAPAPTLADGLALHPVGLSSAEIAGYYEGFSNATLWPLFHDAVVESEFHRHWWDSYRRVNQRFADRAAEVATDGAVVWIHDYQLLLVPQMLRRLRPDVRIGFFQHIPFPPAELYMRLPWRRELLAGMLGADLIGFQVPGAVRNFTRMARSLSGARVSGSVMHFDDRTIRVGAFPISIDSQAQAALAADQEVTAAAAALRADLGNPRRIILGVDRLDYTKGINVRLRAFGELLADRDPAVDDTVMIQIATPSRERLGSYVRMREEIERQVGALNGDYARISRPAVHYLHQSFPRDDLAAFYVAADVMAVTPLRDGMNLVAKEYVACRRAGDGVLLLSEFTGAAAEMRQSVLVNPYDTNGVKDALRTALQMPPTEQRKRMRALRRQVLGHDVNEWARLFLVALEDTKDPVAAAVRRLPSSVVAAIGTLAARPHLLVGTDFDGVLAPIVDDPAAARPLPVAVDALRTLAVLPATTVAVISGRSLDQLHGLLGDAGPVHLVGSHGAEDAGIVGLESSGPAAPTLSQEQEQVKHSVQAAVEEFTTEFPGVRLEPKPTGVAVHVRACTTAIAQQVTARLEATIGTWSGVNLLHGKKVVELQVVSTDKGQALERLRASADSPAVLFIGDDVTDEHAFAVLAAGDMGVKVGAGQTIATHRVGNPRRVADLLTVLAAARQQHLYS